MYPSVPWRPLADKSNHDKRQTKIQTEWLLLLVDDLCSPVACFRIEMFIWVIPLVDRRSWTFPVPSQLILGSKPRDFTFYRPVFLLLRALLFSVCRQDFLRDVNMLWFSLRAMNETSTERTGPTEVLLTSGCRAPLTGPVRGWSRGWEVLASRPCPGSSARPSSSPSWPC